MKNYTVYDDDGNIIRTGFTYGDVTYKNVIYERATDPKNQCVKNGKIVPKIKTDDELIAETQADIRRIRDSLLSKSDWVFVSDSPVKDKTAWAAYRKALRDLPEKYSTAKNIEEVQFPQEP